MADLPRPLPPQPLSARLRALLPDVDARAVAGWVAAAAAVTVAIVVAVAALRAGDTPPPPEMTLPRAGTVGDPSASGGTGPDTSTTVSVTEAQVHVAGAVAHPGLYKLPPGARVAAAIEAAGGATADADVDQINLAAKVADGERIYVPRKGEAIVPTGGSAGGGGVAAPAGPVNLNTATLEQLDTLPGVGPSTAQAILDHRTRNGRFRSVDDLLEVRGIGPSKMEQLRSLVTV